MALAVGRYYVQGKEETFTGISYAAGDALLCFLVHRDSGYPYLLLMVEVKDTLLETLNATQGRLPGIAFT